MIIFNRPDLLLNFLFLSLISQILIHILKPLWLVICRPRDEENSARSEMRILRKEQDDISIKENFSAHAKLQRKLNKLEDELKLLVQARLEKTVKLKYLITYGLQAVLGLIIVSTSIYFRKIPLITFDRSLFPFDSFFSYTADVGHCLVPPAWMIISRVSINTIFNGVTKIHSLLNPAK